MSREFGSYCNGYFHTQIDVAADDCLGGSSELTRKWGEFLKEFYPVAYAISSREACDSGEAFPILECIKHMDALKKKLAAIEEFLRPYREVSEQAVEEAIRGKKAPE